MADIWQHYKGGIYNVIGLGSHTETGEDMVIYEDTNGKVWIRPMKAFMEEVEFNGEKVLRFKKLGDFYK